MVVANVEGVGRAEAVLCEFNAAVGFEAVFVTVVGTAGVEVVDDVVAG